MKFPIPFNKQMGNLWLSITDACNMQCKYCFVPKGRNFLDFEQTKPVIEFFLHALGKQKRIDFYGGEPLMNRKFLEQSIPYAVKLGSKLGKDVRLYISTNATLYKPNMRFLKEYGVHVLVSIDGGRSATNFNRRTATGAPAFDRIVSGLRRMQDELEPHNLCALFTVSPELAEHAYENFEALLDLGFRCANIEAERTPRWTETHKQAFAQQLKLIAKRVLESIDGPRHTWLFLNFFTRRLAAEAGRAEPELGCPFAENFIVYPDGLLCTPPTIVFEDKRDLYIVGDLKHGLLPFYEECSFDPQTERCKRCMARLWGLDAVRDNGAQRLRNEVLGEFAKQLLHRAKTDTRVREYLEESDKWTYV